MRTVGAVLDDAAARAEAKRKRHRVWHWCRRKNGFSDDPLWRVVAERLGMPPFQVIAFVNRLEEHANAATPRGYVGEVSPAVFGAALGMSAEDAARIFAELQTSGIDWIDQEHIATFYERNKDDETEDATAALRSRRSYARRGLRKMLERAVADGLIDVVDAEAVLVELDHMGDDELFELDRRRKAGQLVGYLLSTPHGTSRREDKSSRVRNVRPHTRADASNEKHTGAVDNSGDTARGESAGSATGERGSAEDLTAEQWVDRQGVRIVTERMQLIPSLAATRIERWKRELGWDCLALAAIIDAAAQADYRDARFHVEVTDQISRRLRDATEQRRLPLVTRVPKRGGGAA